jgi:hypothetical protein
MHLPHLSTLLISLVIITNEEDELTRRAQFLSHVVQHIRRTLARINLEI